MGNKKPQEVLNGNIFNTILEELKHVGKKMSANVKKRVQN